MKLVLVMTLALAALLLPLRVLAQEGEQEAEPAPEGWQIASDINLALTQNAYSDNWGGGESGSVSWALSSNTIAENQVAETINNKNTLKLAYGQTHSQDAETKEWARPATTTDLIDFESIFRFTSGWAVDPFVAGRYESKFVDERDTEKRRTFNPTTLTESAGVARLWIKEEEREWLTLFGGAVRQHIDRDALPEGATERETVTSNDGGLEFVSQFRTPLADGAMTFTSDLTIYKALYYSESENLSGPGADDWKSPDVNWENMLAASITEYIVVNLYVQMICEKEVDDALQFKETLSLGFAFKTP